MIVFSLWDKKDQVGLSGKRNVLGQMFYINMIIKKVDRKGRRKKGSLLGFDSLGAINQTTP